MTGFVERILDIQKELAETEEKTPDLVVVNKILRAARSASMISRRHSATCSTISSCPWKSGTSAA